MPLLWDSKQNPILNPPLIFFILSILFFLSRIWRWLESKINNDFVVVGWLSYITWKCQILLKGRWRQFCANLKTISKPFLHLFVKGTTRAPKIPKRQINVKCGNKAGFAENKRGFDPLVLPCPKFPTENSSWVTFGDNFWPQILIFWIEMRHVNTWGDWVFLPILGWKVSTQGDIGCICQHKGCLHKTTATVLAFREILVLLASI